MKKVFVVSTVGDPYEPDISVAICTSLDEVKKLGLAHVWKLVSHIPYNNAPDINFEDRIDKYYFECVITGEKQTIRGHACPSSGR